ncbi:hypothetical protein LWM68_30130 [Niabella sp. W65]|nr:hypothetical protein [Niabella sp. W65]MCH7366647.1 hypothetical protein [Niabella sp. W65]
MFAQQPADDNPLLADPTIFFDKGTYYLYGTSGRADSEGFEVFTSTDQRSWKKRASPSGVETVTVPGAFGRHRYLSIKVNTIWLIRPMSILP